MIILSILLIWTVAMVDLMSIVIGTDYHMANSSLHLKIWR